MSLRGDRAAKSTASFPRVSGDEPLRNSGILVGIKFSPRERG